MDASSSVFDFDAGASNRRRGMTASAVEQTSHRNISSVDDTENEAITNDDIIKDQNAYIKLIEQKQLYKRRLKRDPGFLDIAMPPHLYKKPRTSQVLNLHQDAQLAKTRVCNVDNSKLRFKQEQSMSPERHIKMEPEEQSFANALPDVLNCEIKEEDSTSPKRAMKVEPEQEEDDDVPLDNSSKDPIIIDDDDDDDDKGSDLIILENKVKVKQEILNMEIDDLHAKLNGLNNESLQDVVKIEPKCEQTINTLFNNSSKNPILIDDDDEKNHIAPEVSSENAVKEALIYDSAIDKSTLQCKASGIDNEARKEQKSEMESLDEGSLFVNSSDAEDQCNLQSKKMKRKAYKPNVKKAPKIHEAILNASMEIGLQYIAEMHKLKTGSKRSEALGTFDGSRGKINMGVNLGKERNGSQNDISWTSNIFKDIGRNLFESDEPSFTSSTKKESFKEIRATTDLTKPANRKDLRALERAWENFHGKASVKSNGNGQWSVKGMISSLRSYQLVGVAFLRRRENGSTPPRGGLNADVMGLGKTIMMLANIVNDKLGMNPNGRKRNKTTLIVTTAGLVTQWSDEIKKHCERDYAGRVMIYRTGSKIDSHDLKDLMQEHDIIVTTYYEVMRSYPAIKPPSELKSFEEKETWWKKEFELNRAILHRIYFRRIVLDEAAVMKNYAGRTSMACQALMGKYRWAISGTPVQNTPLEFYPYFKFLQLPHSRTIEIFRHNYYNQRDQTSIKRLRAILEQITLRRTHVDYFLGKPLLPLKAASEKTCTARFNDFERNIYDMVMKSMQQKLNETVNKNDSGRLTVTALTMLLRLRQLVSHIFLIRGVAFDLLTKKNVTILRALARKFAKLEDYGEQLYEIRQMIAEEKTVDMKKSIANCGNIMSNTDEMEAERMEELDSYQDNEAEHLQRYDARNFIKQLQETKERKLKEQEAPNEQIAEVRYCNLCEIIAENPYITDCNHVYCSECFTDLQENFLGEPADKNQCIHCGANCTIKQMPKKNEAQSESSISLKTKTPNSCKSRRGHNASDDNDIRSWIKRSPNLRSAKILAVIAQIKNWWKKDSTAKIIVYTHFIDMIEILGHMCRTEKWEYCEYHGKQNMKNRDKALRKFHDEPRIGILLMSIKCGGLGLNITVASRVIIVDPWWNYALEEQAFCRIFRYGQTKATTMSRIVVAGTVDEKMLRMQEAKRAKIDGVMGNNEDDLKPSLEELMSLFKPIEDPHDKEGFIYNFEPDIEIPSSSDDDGDGRDESDKTK